MHATIGSCNNCYPCYCLPFDDETARHLICDSDYVDHFPIAIPRLLKDVIVHISLTATYIVRMPEIHRVEFPLLEYFRERNNLLLNCTSLNTWYYWQMHIGFAGFETDCPVPDEPPTLRPTTHLSTTVDISSSSLISTAVATSTPPPTMTSPAAVTSPWFPSNERVEFLATVITCGLTGLMLCVLCIWTAVKYVRRKRGAGDRGCHQRFAPSIYPMSVFTIAEDDGSDDDSV